MSLITGTSEQLIITDAAVERIKTLLAKESKPDAGLRLYISGGGCAGMSYGMSIDDAVSADDAVVKTKGVKVLVDKLSLIYLRGSKIDFVDLGCPHYNLEQLRVVAEALRGKKIAEGVRFWVCTNRMTRKQAEYSGYVQDIEDSGAVVVADTCPVESHMRQSTCREYGLEIPNVKAMVTDSVKMSRYVRDLIGCETVLAHRDHCIQAALAGRWL